MAGAAGSTVGSAAPLSRETIATWAAGLDDLMAHLAPRFRRLEVRERARRYLAGLIAPVERKNG